MAETRPFIVTTKTVLTGSGTGTASYQVGAGQQLEIDEVIVSCTGAFNITDIRNSNGINYTNANTNTPIPSTLMANGADAYNGISRLSLAITIKGNEQILFDLTDTSTAANTVYITFVGRLTVGL